MSQAKSSYFDQAAATWDDKPARIALMKAVGDAILREVRPTPETSVLDYGCGTGLVGLFLLPHVGQVTGADSSSGMLEVLQQKITSGGLANMRTLRLDLERDPLPAARYDLIVSNMTLHHIADTGRILGAWYQLLNPQGALCVADLDTEPGLFHDPAVAHRVPHHGFNRGDLMALMTRIGFQRTNDVTAHSIRKPVNGGVERDFPVFLITARKTSGEVLPRV